MRNKYEQLVLISSFVGEEDYIERIEMTELGKKSLNGIVIYKLVLGEWA